MPCAAPLLPSSSSVVCPISLRLSGSQRRILPETHQRRLADAHKPGWRAYLLKKAELAVDAGVDAIMWDNMIGYNEGLGSGSPSVPMAGCCAKAVVAKISIRQEKSFAQASSEGPRVLATHDPVTGTGSQGHSFLLAAFAGVASVVRCSTPAAIPPERGPRCGNDVLLRIWDRL